MKKIYISFSSIALIVLVVSFVRFTPTIVAKADQYVFYSSANATSTLCVRGKPTLILATSTGARTRVQVTNIGSGSMWIGLGNQTNSVTAATSSGLLLTASTSVT